MVFIISIKLSSTLEFGLGSFFAFRVEYNAKFKTLLANLLKCHHDPGKYFAV